MWYTRNWRFLGSGSVGKSHRLWFSTTEDGERKYCNRCPRQELQGSCSVAWRLLCQQAVNRRSIWSRKRKKEEQT